MKTQKLNSVCNTENQCLNELVLSYHKKEQLNNFKSINNSSKFADFLRKIWNDQIDISESFYLICLNTSLDVIGYRKIADGGLNSVLVDKRLIFSTALLANATRIVVAHNHPSGNANPSSEDLLITKKILDAGKILDIKLLDHIIITSDKYYSLSDEGHI